MKLKHVAASGYHFYNYTATPTELQFIAAWLAQKGIPNPFGHVEDAFSDRDVPKFTPSVARALVRFVKGAVR